MNKLLIHNDNIAYKNMFENNIKLPPIENIDDNISKNIIPKIKSSDCDIVFIKDNLSTNYLELYGFRVVYHIRLSEELGEKRFLPIVILSDIDSHILNKIESMGKVLFTKNIFIGQSKPETVAYFDRLQPKPLHKDKYQMEFLDKINIAQPKDYLSHHSIANEWAMHRWAEYLDINTKDIQYINTKIDSMLYFKYLKAKFPIKKSIFKKHQRKINQKGKILYIDDEWKKGWGDILKSLHPNLQVAQEQYKDKTKEEIVDFVVKKAKEINPDLVILDMRLHKDDFQNQTDELTGIQIFEQIKELNKGIQFIIFTASSDSELFEKLQSHDTNIISYIKKEHPDDTNKTTQSNINKLIYKINQGLEKKYLKEVWNTNQRIQELLDSDPFGQYIDDFDQYETNLGKLKKESSYIFNILNSGIENKINYALISLATSIDALREIFIKEEWDRNTRKKSYYYIGGNIFKSISKPIHNLPDLILQILEESGYQNEYNIKKELNNLNDKRRFYIHSNQDYIQPKKETIVDWFILLEDILNKIKNNKAIKERPQKQFAKIEGLEGFSK